MCVAIKHLCLAFGSCKLFQHFNFELPKGKWTTLLGSSGVGKSTLLRTIAGLEDRAVQAGEICFASNTRLAWLAQTDSLYPWLSLVDNVQLHAHLSGQKSAETYQKAVYLLEQVGLSDHLHKPCYQLSGGQRQRVALARTLMQEANLILMDEPFSALDAVTRHQLQSLAVDLLRGKTVLLITHDPQEAIRVSDEIRILRGLPAELSSVYPLTGLTPRTLENQALWQLQQQLFEALISEGKTSGGNI